MASCGVQVLTNSLVHRVDDVIAAQAELPTEQEPGRDGFLWGTDFDQQLRKGSSDVEDGTRHSEALAKV